MILACSSGRPSLADPCINRYWLLNDRCNMTEVAVSRENKMTIRRINNLALVAAIASLAGTGLLEVRRKFTNELDKAAERVRVPLGTAGAGAYNPCVEIIEGLRRFDSQPLGRRAMIVISDGIDVSRGVDSSTAGQSVDLQRA